MAAAEREGLVLAAKVRLAIILLVLIMQAATTDRYGAAYAYAAAMVLVLGVLSVAHWWAAASGPRWRPVVYALFALDVACLGIVLAAGNPFASVRMTPPELFHAEPFYWFFIFLLQASFSVSWQLVAWTGIWIIVVRIMQFAWAYLSPATVTKAALAGLALPKQMDAVMHATFMAPQQLIADIVITAAVAGGLAVLMGRSRTLVARVGAAERERGSLARYFSPGVVDTLAGREDDVRQPRRQRLAVMFVDIVGFTRLCEHASPEWVVDLLRGYHDRVGEAVFVHGGSIDKYVGDGLMATFGTPLPMAAPASSALNCALAMVAAMDEWNRERSARGLAPIRIGIGLHMGEAIVGDIGNARRLEFAVIGDVVNVASRIEHLTRSLHSPLAASDALVAAARAEGDTAAGAIACLRPSGSQALRGRRDPIDIWVLGKVAQL